MKKLLRILLVVLMGMAFVVMPVFALGATPQSEVSDPVQLYVIGAVASAVLYALKVLAARFPKIVINREWLSVLLYVVALGLAVYWGGMAIPAFAAFKDPVTFVAALLGWVNALLLALAVPVSYATLIYNLLLKRVLDGFTEKYFPSAVPALSSAKRK